MNAATNQPSIVKLRLGQSDQAGHGFKVIADEASEYIIIASALRMLRG